MGEERLESSRAAREVGELCCRCKHTAASERDWKYRVEIPWLTEVNSQGILPLKQRKVVLFANILVFHG